MIMESKVVFIGAGNMAEAIVSGMVAGGFCAPEKIIMTDIRPERLADLEREYGVSTSTDNCVVKNAEIVVLAFDGNIESLPGRYIFTTEANRTVAVDSRGLLEAIKDLFKATRLSNELVSGKISE